MGFHEFQSSSLEGALGHFPKSYPEDLERTTNRVLEILQLTKQKVAIDEEHADFLRFCALHVYDTEPAEPNDALLDRAVDMTLRLDNAGALPTCPQPQQQAKVA